VNIILPIEEVMMERCSYETFGCLQMEAIHGLKFVSMLLGQVDKDKLQWLFKILFMLWEVLVVLNV
jgi:hypothetical protein